MREFTFIKSHLEKFHFPKIPKIYCVYYMYVHTHTCIEFDLRILQIYP